MTPQQPPLQRPDRSLWRTSRRTLAIGARPLVMGILNVTPDSFSDGGKYSSSFDAAVSAGIEMADRGADILDIGGESTRPYADPVDAETEIGRVVPVIERLARELRIPISIDTSKASVAWAAIDAGAEIINDVTGLEGDPAMIDAAIASRAGVCVMHMRGTPQTMQDDPRYDDVVEEIRGYLIDRRDALWAEELHHESICLDPGIGFGKTHEHNWQLVAGISRFIDLGCPVLIGHSRKGFIRKRLSQQSFNVEPLNPMAGTLGVSLAAAAAGAHVLRVHDVAETVQALATFFIDPPQLQTR